MRIIKRGKITEKEKQKKCGECKTKFSYKPSDVQSDRDGKYVICPCCGKLIAVD